MPWRGLNNRTLLLKRKTKTFAGAMWKTSRTRRFLILLLQRDFSVAVKIDFEVHTGWISSLGEHLYSLQCMKQLQDTVLNF
ncbi:hypothetical protein HanRHA438_Chr14g0632891 [Helianthus annuus]|nr:hypothetical protein HanRHA438_Chr14g0632891 [Helianthus annuus]